MYVHTYNDDVSLAPAFIFSSHIVHTYNIQHLVIPIPCHLLSPTTNVLLFLALQSHFPFIYFISNHFNRVYNFNCDISPQQTAHPTPTFPLISSSTQSSIQHSTTKIWIKEHEASRLSPFPLSLSAHGANCTLLLSKQSMICMCITMKTFMITSHITWL
jgi:hypothetical protein